MPLKAQKVIKKKKKAPSLAKWLGKDEEPTPSLGPCPTSATRDPTTIMAFNVASLRAAVKKEGFLEYLKMKSCDVIFISETKITSKSFAKFASDLKTKSTSIISGYRMHYNLGIKKEGYASTAVLIKDDIKYISITDGVGHPDHDGEGRFITVRFPSFTAVHAYVPNSGRGGKRGAKPPASLGYRVEFEGHMRGYLKGLMREAPVVYCGDLNVCHQEIDIFNLRNKGSPGFTDEERAEMTRMQRDLGLIDSYRRLHPDTVQYSWFSNFGSARAKMHGWRLDYFMVDPRVWGRVQESVILDEDRFYSDHCPIMLTLTE
eukprot:gnl/Dysnectes_brevis/185_a214_6645.p1 GENE.gnl/Dysnectes_brevis/185_a214_6645~~gnl/Dysnectes_brevis/185_a214_6645.p1  ORF type:complete len:317 (+),score=60.68 gnl/Dysnectes_brevis/185_a214_6645:626-1576(+)